MVILFKGKKVSKEWLFNQIKKGELEVNDVSKIEVSHKRVEIKKKKEKDILPTFQKPLAFNHFLLHYTPDELKEKRLFGCIVNNHSAKMVKLGLSNITSPVSMVEIPMECIRMVEKEVIKVISTKQRF